MDKKSPGPRTAQGKARSSRNSLRHGILSGRVLPQENSQAAVLFKEFCTELQPQGVLEREIVSDLVINRLQKRRIDAFISNEFERSRLSTFRGIVEKRAENGASYWSTDRDRFKRVRDDRLPAGMCCAALVALRSEIQQDGLRPDENVMEIERVYGARPTEGGAMILNLYRGVKIDAANEATRNEYLREILATLDQEILYQQERQKIEADLALIECSPYAPPPGPFADLVLRYSSANAREFTHHLESLQRVRSLKCTLTKTPIQD